MDGQGVEEGHSNILRLKPLVTVLVTIASLSQSSSVTIAIDLNW